MKSWQERGEPYDGYEYTALTPHYFWDGRSHYWTGMAVKGAEDQNPDNPNCCHDLDFFEGGEVTPDAEVLRYLRASLRARGLTHRAAGEKVGYGLSRLRERLYGRRSMRRGDFFALCRLAGVDGRGLDRRGCDEG